jgi:hypothetical protein
MMATSWMFHDTWFLPGRATRWLYAAMFPAFDLALLAADTFGGHGLLATLAQHHDWVVAMLACQVLVAVLMQAYMVNLEVEALAHDKALIHERALEHELTLARREREIVQGSAMLLATGVNASKFSHDVTWPATVVDMTARVINEMLDDAPADAPREWVRVLRAAMVDVTNSAQCVMQMTSALATSLRTGEVVGPVAVTQLGDEVAQFFRRAMRGHGIVPVKPRVRLETVDVWVTPGHASSLGNLLVNGGLQAPGEALEMTGAPLDEWFYLLRVRDFGVADQERETALRTVQATLDSLESSSRISIPDDNGASYRGFGVGLLLAKIHLLRHNGAIAVTTPVEGPGLEFLIALPRVDPATIPESENQPERLLRELPRRQVSVPTIAQAS